MKVRNVCAIGHYRFGANLANGQTVKTRVVTDALERRLGRDQVLRMDTHGRLALLKAPFQVLRGLWTGRNLVLFPGFRGVRVLVPLAAGLNRLFDRSLHYVVIGGWLPGLLREKPGLRRALTGFAGIYVETAAMKKELEDLGLAAAAVLPNCKELPVLTEEKLTCGTGMPCRLCTFSRVMRVKGIEDAIVAVKAVNARRGGTVCTLDVYGQVDLREKDWFGDLERGFPGFIRYGGVVPYENSVEVLRAYDALLFPTWHEGEGLAGTLIDAMAAGLPVVASHWRYNPEVVREGITGALYPVRDVEALAEKLEWILDHREEWNAQRPACLTEAGRYRPGAAVKVLLDRLDGEA